MSSKHLVDVPEERHILALDGLRGVAILLVIMFHSCAAATPVPITWFGRFFHGIAERGWTGVDLFFVLSGFLITRSLLDARETANYFRVFYTRRVLRIFPLYFIFLIGFFGILPILEHYSTALTAYFEGRFSATEQLWYWFSLVNLRTPFNMLAIPMLSHLWSLSIEDQFYAVWPAIVYFCSVKRLPFICWSGIVFAIVARQLPIVRSLDAVHDNFIYRFTPFRIDSLLIGALLAIYLHQRVWTPSQRQRCFYASCSVFIAGIVIFVLYLTHNNRIGFTLLAFSYAALLLACLTGPPVARIFRSAPLRIMGKYSYCIYIIHPIVIFGGEVFLKRCLHLGSQIFASYPEEVLFSVCCTFLCLGIARISWIVVEQPFLRLKKNFRYSSTCTVVHRLQHSQRDAAD